MQVNPPNSSTYQSQLRSLLKSHDYTAYICILHTKPPAKQNWSFHNPRINAPLTSWMTMFSKTNLRSSISEATKLHSFRAPWSKCTSIPCPWLQRTYHGWGIGNKPNWDAGGVVWKGNCSTLLSHPGQAGLCMYLLQMHPLSAMFHHVYLGIWRCYMSKHEVQNHQPTIQLQGEYTTQLSPPTEAGFFQCDMTFQKISLIGKTKITKTVP